METRATPSLDEEMSFGACLSANREAAIWNRLVTPTLGDRLAAQPPRMLDDSSAISP
jgi:hypothetical protein